MIDVAVNGRFMTQRRTGVQRYAREVARRLQSDRRLSMVRLIAPSRSYPHGDETAGMPETDRVGRLSGHLWEQFELPRSVAPHEVLWSPCNVGPVSRRRHVVTIHDLFSIQRPQWVGRRFHLWYSAILPVLTRRCSHVIVVSEHTRDHVQDVLSVEGERITVVPEGVDRAFAPADGDRIRAVRRAHALPDRFVLALGSLEPRKNLERLLLAWSRIPDPRRLPLVVAGGLGDPRVFGRTQLATVLAEQGVHTLGYVPERDLPALYSAASLFVYPSLEEGFGLPPLEAIACGTPTITSDNSGMAENCRGMAMLVDPLDVEALAAAIETLSHDPPDPRTLDAARARVRAKFDWDRTAQGVAGVLVNHAGR